MSEVDRQPKYPDWHGKVLADRARSIREGKTTYISLAELKKPGPLRQSGPEQYLRHCNERQTPSGVCRRTYIKHKAPYSLPSPSENDSLKLSAGRGVGRSFSAEKRCLS